MEFVNSAHNIEPLVKAPTDRHTRLASMLEAARSIVTYFHDVCVAVSADITADKRNDAGAHPAYLALHTAWEYATATLGIESRHL